MLFSTFSKALEELEQLSSRLDMTERLAQLFEALSVDELAPASYLMQGSLVPTYESLEFQLSTKMVLRALARTKNTFSVGSEVTLFGQQDTTAAEKELQKRYKKQGDVGAVAAEWVSGSDSKHTLLHVFEQLRAVARASGSGSQEVKVALLVSLLDSVDATSAKFIARIIIGKVRLGFSAMTMLDALSWSVCGDKSHRTLLEEAYQKQADVGQLARTYLADRDTSRDYPEKVLAQYTVSVGVPVVPALCHRLNTSQEIIDKMGEVIAEPKYDGLRVQIHFNRNGFEDGETVRAYTRNLEDVTHMFPELAVLQTVTKAETLILDTEAIGFDVETGALLPFQETITRKRKHNIASVSESVPIKFFVFDVLYRDGIGFIEMPLRDRKDVLDNLFTENRTFDVAEFITTKNPDTLREYHEEQLAKGLEGAVIKKIDAHYQSGRKGWKWVKIKEEEGTSGKLKDTLDVVVMGYFSGRGKRSQFGIGALLVGVLDAQTETIKTIAKIGTGLSEKRLVELKSICDKLRAPEKPSTYQVDASLIPDVWTHPSLVIEVAADEITRSPNHTAKVALRFPRLMTVREDKSWQDATTIEELSSL